MQTVSEQSAPVPTPPWLRGRRRYVTAILGAVLFFTPAVARLFGVYPTPIENRPLVALPPLSDGLHIFDALTQWSIDHLPLRGLAVRADAKISETIFGEPPSYAFAAGPVGLGQAPKLQGGRAGTTITAGLANQVFAGRDGWLFLGDEIIRGCMPELTLEQVTTGLRRLERMVAASGRKLVLLIPPDKSTVDGRFLPPDIVDGPCAKRSKAARWSAIDALRLSGFTDLRPRLVAEERASGSPAYLRIDSHWTSRSVATVFLPAILDPLSPKLYASAHVQSTGPTSYTGDLSMLNGAPQHATDIGWDVTRPGVVAGPTTTTTPLSNFPITHYINSAPRGVPLVRVPALIYGDSFTERAMPFISLFFSDLTRIPEISRAAVERPAARAAAIALLAALLKRTDVVVVEQTERVIAGSRQGSILAPDVLDALQRALASAPLGRG